MPPSRKFFRSRNDRIFAGLCGGLGAYLDIDSSILRIGWVFVTVLSGVAPGVVVYIIAIFLVSLEPDRPRSIQASVVEMPGKQ